MKHLLVYNLCANKTKVTTFDFSSLLSSAAHRVDAEALSIYRRINGLKKSQQPLSEGHEKLADETTVASPEVSGLYIFIP